MPKVKLHVGMIVKSKIALDYPSKIQAGDEGTIILPDTSKPEYLVRFTKNGEQRWMREAHLTKV